MYYTEAPNIASRVQSTPAILFPHLFPQTLLSLGKLAALLSDSSHPEKAQDLGRLNQQLQLIEFQQNIPLEALEVENNDS